MATNYTSQLSKQQIREALHASALSDLVVARILDNIDFGFGDQLAWVEEFDSAPTGADIQGNDLVIINGGGDVDLSGVTKGELFSVDAFVFTGNADVNFTLAGPGTFNFDGLVVTNAGNDTITLNSAVGAQVMSGDGNDSVTTGRGDDTVDAGAGDDTIDTGAGDDSVVAGDGNDEVVTGLGNDTVWGGAGDDTVTTGVGDDSVSGGQGHDSIDTGVGDDYVATGAGNDSVETGQGKDTVTVGAGDDTVKTGAGNDLVILDTGFTGDARLGGGTGAFDKLDLTNVVITDVTKVGPFINITLDDGSVVTTTQFEQFVYDTNGADPGGVQTTGVYKLLQHDFTV